MSLNYNPGLKSHQALPLLKHQREQVSQRSECFYCKLLATVFHHLERYKRIQSDYPEWLGMCPSMQSPSICDEMCNKESQTAEKVRMRIIWAVAGFYLQCWKIFCYWLQEEKLTPLMNLPNKDYFGTVFKKLIHTPPSQHKSHSLVTDSSKTLKNLPMVMITVKSTMKWIELLGKIIFSCPSLGTKLSRAQRKTNKQISCLSNDSHLKKTRPHSEVTLLLSLKWELKLFSCS